MEGLSAVVAANEHRRLELAFLEVALFELQRHLLALLGKHLVNLRVALSCSVLLFVFCRSLLVRIESFPIALQTDAFVFKSELVVFLFARVAIERVLIKLKFVVLTFWFSLVLALEVLELLERLAMNHVHFNYLNSKLL